MRDLISLNIQQLITCGSTSKPKMATGLTPWNFLKVFFFSSSVFAAAFAAAADDDKIYKDEEEDGALFMLHMYMSIAHQSSLSEVYVLVYSILLTYGKSRTPLRTHETTQWCTVRERQSGT